jgi:hypothetical protein
MMRAPRPPLPRDPEADELGDYIAQLERQRDGAIFYARVTGAFAGIIALVTIFLLDAP